MERLFLDELEHVTCLETSKDCKTCIYCSADYMLWNMVENKFEANIDPSFVLSYYFKIKHKRNPYEQSVKRSYLQLTESEVPFFLRRY